ncbi:MAG: sulfur carrier protein ThiS adenylyltransferase ThiF [Bacteroidetes bacterium]|nr:sulfur carrier protein ThiS adenylyltransferase ThiF [Bacteroidota bacterium]
MIEAIKNILKTKTIGIAGVGGLGSNCAVSLARVNVGNLIIADFDVIEKSNLNRQYYFYNQIGQKKVSALKNNIKNINPDVKVKAVDIKLNSENIIELFKNCDVIIEAFDKAEMKQMIIETVLDKMPDKTLIVGVGMAGWGNNNTLKTKKTGNLYICGDGVSEVCDKEPALAPRVGIVANMLANQALEILLNNL